ncbi:MAG: DUF6178 family protein [Thermodesulfobacteriota bacterium]|nr:DUF6178 family protein [Thermodesulfobacteriota bacterium]
MDNQPVAIKKKIVELAEKRRKAMMLPAREAMDMILDAKDAMPMVHSFAEQDFYFLVNEIGPHDAIELLSLASNKQWEYMLDVSVWQQDEIHIDSVVQWFDLLMRADANRFRKWMITDKAPFLELFLYYNLEVGMLEHDQDPSVFGPEFFTFDDLYYVRFVKKGKCGMDTDEKADDFRQKVLYGFLKRLAEQDYEAYMEVLFYTANVLPAEAEEEAYRLRNVRLAEKGLLPFEEAVGVYRYVRRADQLPEKGAPAGILDAKMPVPFSPTTMIDRTTVFSQALACIDSQEALQELQTEFAALCNRIAVSDRMAVKEKKDLAHVVDKACGYIHIGLQEVIEGDAPPDAGEAAALMGRYFITDIFRLGYSAVSTLKRQADKWYLTSWTIGHKMPLVFWGERRQGALGGLLVKRPLYYDQYQDGGIYREFQTPSEVAATRDILDEVMMLDRLLKDAGFDPSCVAEAALTFENLVLTVWARHYLGLAETVEYISIDNFRRFFAALMTADPEQATRRRIRNKMKGAFLEWFAGVTGNTAYDLSRAAGRLFEVMFAAIEAEYGNVAPDNLDARYVELFLVYE